MRRLSGAAAWLGMAAIASAVALLGLLQVLPPSSALDPTRRTISQYALLTNGWIFDLAVLLLAGGSLSILVALLRVRLLDRRPAAVAALLLWCVSLVAVVWFEKHNWAVGPSLDGSIHRVASVVAFLSLPAAALLSARGRLRDPQSRRPALATYCVSAGGRPRAAGRSGSADTTAPGVRRHVRRPADHRLRRPGRGAGLHREGEALRSMIRERVVGGPAAGAPSARQRCHHHRR